MTDHIWTAEEIEAAAGLLAVPTGRYRFNDTFAAMLRQQAARIKELEAQVDELTTTQDPLYVSRLKYRALIEHAEAMAEALENCANSCVYVDVAHKDISGYGVRQERIAAGYVALAAYRKWKEGQDEGRD